MAVLLFALLASQVVLQAQSTYTTPYTFTTLAGLAPGSTDGTGRAARFRHPESVAVDNSGNVYVVDTDNCTIRKITAAGVVTTLAGSAGNYGWADGTGSAARFYGPRGVAVDSSGNVYIGDTYNNAIRKVTPAGVVSTIAGSAGFWGSVDGTGSAARFNRPRGVAVDSSGNVYVSDTDNSIIRKITPAGVVTTLAGSAGSVGSVDGTASGARFNYPESIATDSSGNVYVADFENCVIRKITPAGVVTTLAGLAGSGGSTDGTGSNARFSGPSGIAVDSSSNVYIADWRDGTIRKITHSGVVTTLAGSAGTFGSADGTGSAARFDFPWGIAVDSSGKVYVADMMNCTIRMITPAGVVSTLAGAACAPGGDEATGSAARFHGPAGVAVDSSGYVYVGDVNNCEIRRIRPEGLVETILGLVNGSADGQGRSAQFSGPAGVAMDNAGNLFVADSGNDNIRKVTPLNHAGVVTTFAGLAGSPGSANGTGGNARFRSPRSVAIDSSGNVYVADTYNCTIRKITPSGVVTTLAGSAGSSGSVDGTGSAARFAYPWGVAVDSSGNVYVADTDNCTIRKITPAGVVTTFAGLAGSPDSADGIGSNARFAYPCGVAVDSSGNVYVADMMNCTVRKITPAGIVTTLAGSACLVGSTDGTGSAARFAYPRSVAVDSAGTVYVADTDNNVIRVGLPSPIPVITSATSAAGTVGAAFTYTITASNSPTAYSAAGLPGGLTLNTSTGVISGKPTSAGAASVTLTATNLGGTSANALLTITIAASNSSSSGSGSASSSGGGGAVGGLFLVALAIVGLLRSSKTRNSR